MRLYTIRTPGGAVTVTAARAVVEHGGALALYGRSTGECSPPEREILVAAFSPIGWLSFEAADG